MIDDRYYNIEPEYFGTNIVRYENFLADLVTLINDKDLNWNLTKTLAYLIKKYELTNYIYFNYDAYNFLMETFGMYYNKYMNMVNEKIPQEGQSDKSDLSLLLSLKGK